MRIEIPKTFRGREVEGAIERVLSKQKAQETQPSNQPVPPVNASNLDGFIYVPSINLYVAKERSLLGKNWYDSHKELHKQELRMPTLPEIGETIFYLRDNQNNPELKQVYDDILKKTQSGWHGEWVNAKFKIDDKKYVQTVTGIDSNGELVYSNLEEITCFDNNCYVDITTQNNVDKQGLPTVKSSDNSYKQGENLYFWYPRDGSVAGFVADSDRAGLGCDGGPGGRDDALGVFACAEGTQKNAGGSSK